MGVCYQGGLLGRRSRTGILLDPNHLEAAEADGFSAAALREAIRLMLELNKGGWSKKANRARRMMEHLVPIWGRACAYCGDRDVRLEVEHMVPLSRGGEDALANMTIACFDCNRRKRTKTPAEFGVFPVARLG